MIAISLLRKWPSLLGFWLLGFLGGLCLAQCLPGKNIRQLNYQVPNRDDIFISNTFGSDLSHVALWHDIGRSIENAKDAELIIIGNSRTQFGMREDVVLLPLRERGIRAFTLAVGFNETGRFFYELIRRHDLRPKVLLVNLDDRFFSGQATPYADEVMGSSWWEGRKKFYGDRLAWWLETRVNRLFPRWIPFAWGTDVIYRSETTGSWLPIVELNGRIPIPPEFELPVAIPKRDDSFMVAFKNEIDARGIALVLTVTPRPGVNRGRLRNFGERWQVPVVAPELVGLATSDGNHLTRRSAERFGRVLVEELLQLSEIRALTDP